MDTNFAYFIPAPSIGNQLPNYGVTPSRSQPAFAPKGSPNVALMPGKLTAFSSLARDAFEPFIGPQAAPLGSPNVSNLALLRYNQIIHGLYSMPITGLS